MLMYLTERHFISTNQIEAFFNLLILKMKTNLMKLTLLYQTFYENIDFTRSNMGRKKLGIATGNI